MGNKATLGPLLRVGLTGLVLAAVAVAQAPDWRRVGNSALDLELAGLATGPVDRVWYSATGDQIWARSLSGKTFVTNDLDHWVAAAPGSLAPPVPEGRTITIPENGAQVRNPASASPRVYAFRQFVHRSDNSGKNWENLTAFRGLSIIGEGLRDLAVSPTNEDEIVVAGSAGVFRSVDGGRSWSSLNETLPNLPSARIRSLPEGPQGSQIELVGAMVVEWQPGERQAWRPTFNAKAEDERALRQVWSGDRGVAVTALIRADRYIYTGMADGGIMVSADGGSNWQPEYRSNQGSGAVAAFWVDPADPRVALAVLSVRRVLHTIDGGLSWVDISANLPARRNRRSDRAASAGGDAARADCAIEDRR